MAADPCTDFSGTWKLNCVSPSSASRVETVVIHQTGCTQIQIDRKGFVFGKETTEKELIGQGERFTRYLMTWDGDGVGWRMQHSAEEYSPEKGIHFSIKGLTVGRLLNKTFYEDRRESSLRTEPGTAPKRVETTSHCVSLH